jgi:putative aldouronate transport system permease protein
LGRSYLNTVIYTVFGATYSMILTTFGAFALSRRNLIGKNLMMFLIFFTMIFSGGMIPTYLVVVALGLYNSYAAIIFPCAVSAYYLIVMRTFMQQVPYSMEESAKIDGANDFTVLFRIYLPMSIPVLATIGLFYAVDRWNDWFSAMLYLSSTSLYPVQLVIRNLLITMTDNLVNQKVSQGSGVSTFTPTGFKCAVIVVTIVPIIAVYPFLQKYFVKGVMIGAIKG